MELTPCQIATRYMATEVAYINRLLWTRDMSKAQAKRRLEIAAHDARLAAGEDVTIKFGINAGRAWFNIL